MQTQIQMADTVTRLIFYRATACDDSSSVDWTIVTAFLPACRNASSCSCQNAAARLIFGLRPRDHVTSALQQLHWLPIHYRIQFVSSIVQSIDIVHGSVRRQLYSPPGSHSPVIHMPDVCRTKNSH